MSKPNQIVNVTVVNGLTAVDKPTVDINIDDKNQVIWRTDQDETFVVVFQKESPFDEDVLTGTKSDPICSGGATTNLKDHKFHYKIKVHKGKTLDPVVHTDP